MLQCLSGEEDKPPRAGGIAPPSGEEFQKKDPISEGSFAFGAQRVQQVSAASLLSSGLWSAVCQAGSNSGDDRGDDLPGGERSGEDKRCDEGGESH